MDIQGFLIDETKSVLEAMAQLDKVAKKVLFISSENGLAATLTDGDIRRWILRKGSLDAPIRLVANYNPVYLSVGSEHEAQIIMKRNSIEAIPIVNENKVIQSIVFWTSEKVNLPSTFKLPVVIMAGGLGTRLYPYTKILPKPLIPIGEIPIVEHIINRFHEAGSDQFHLVVNHKKNMIKAYFNEIEAPYAVSYADEEQPLGTGGGLSLLKGKIDETFILTNCDILIEEAYEKIVAHHKNEQNLITMVCSLKNIKIPYGVVEITEQGEIDQMREKPELSFFTNTGMYIVEPSVIEELEENVSLGFPDIIESYKAKGRKVGVYPISEHAWLDMGQLDEMEKMRQRLERHEA